MFSFFMYVFIFAAIAILCAFFAIVLSISRAQKKMEKTAQREQATVIDVTPIEENPSAEPANTKSLLKP